jgi:hypothetical protein
MRMGNAIHKKKAIYMRNVTLNRFFVCCQFEVKPTERNPRNHASLARQGCQMEIR